MAKNFPMRAVGGLVGLKNEEGGWMGAGERGRGRVRSWRPVRGLGVVEAVEAAALLLAAATALVRPVGWVGEGGSTVCS